MQIFRQQAFLDLVGAARLGAVGDDFGDDQDREGPRDVVRQSGIGEAHEPILNGSVRVSVARRGVTSDHPPRVIRSSATCDSNRADIVYRGSRIGTSAGTPTFLKKATVSVSGTPKWSVYSAPNAGSA